MRPAILFASILMLSGAQLRANIAIAVIPQVQTVPAGGMAQVQVGISGLGLNAAPSIGAYDLNLAFNPAVLSFTGLTFGDPVKGDQLDPSGIGTISGFSNAPAGQLEFFEVSLDQAAVLDSLQSNRFILATLQFSAIAGGTSLLVPSLNSIGDSQGASLDAGLQGGSINVAATPEPGTFWVLALGAGCLAWRVRRGHSV